MSREILDRVMTAAAYQKKAVYALFSEEMGVHLSAIEKEIKEMAAEAMEAWLRDDREKDRNDSQNYSGSKECDKDNFNAGKNNYNQQLSVKKIDII